jgi:hypothetical protein
MSVWMRFEAALAAELARAKPLLSTFPTPGINPTTLDATFVTVATILRPTLAILAPYVLKKCPAFCATEIERYCLDQCLLI